MPIAVKYPFLSVVNRVMTAKRRAPIPYPFAQVRRKGYGYEYRRNKRPKP